VVRSTRLCIRHELLALPGAKLSDITEVYSHEQAIGQCSRFLTGLNGVRVVPCDNTAAAAAMVAERGDKHVAAISSHPCAAPVRLECLKDDNPGQRQQLHPLLLRGQGPCDLRRRQPHQPHHRLREQTGALYDILSKLAALGINMTKLESCPVTGRNFEFIFFLELEASVHEPGVLPMLKELERSCQSFQFLGSYAEV
jgi:chorismate mutase/prephenate dehydratase